MTKKTPISTTTIAVTVISVLLVATATIFAFRTLYPKASESDNSLAPSVGGGTDTPSDNPEPTPLPEDVAEETEADTPTQYEGQDPNASGTLDANLTYYGRQGEQYLVNINISQYVSGTCSLTLGDYHTTIAIDRSAASSACSFALDPSRLAAGQQKLIVEVTADNKKTKVEEKIDVSL